MPKNITCISVFLASPSDVSREREVVAQTINHWNTVNSRHKDVTFDLMRWETSVSSGFGQDGQDVINNQIDDQYDVLIALFWTRLGSATPRATSGTVEEYERALERHGKDRSVEIAFYFKNAAIDFRNADLMQLQGVKDLELAVQSQGALTKPFADDDALRFEIDLLLDRIAREMGSGSHTSRQLAVHARTAASAGSEIESSIGEGVKSAADDEPGLLDIVESLATCSKNSTEFITELVRRLSLQAEKMNSVTIEIENISSVRQMTSSEMRLQIDSISEIMNHFSAFLEENSASFDENVAQMIEKIRQLIDVSYDFVYFDNEDFQHLPDFQLSLIGMQKAMSEANNGLDELLKSTKSLQRMTTSFNKSRRKFVINLELLKEYLTNRGLMLGKAIDELSQLLGSIQTGKLSKKSDVS